MDKPKTEAEALVELVAALEKLTQMTIDNVRLMSEAAKVIYGSHLIVAEDSAEERLRKGEEGEP